MKLEVGKYYRTRDGRKVGPLGEFSEGTMHTGVSDSRLWNLDGSRYYRNDPNSDLIAEWHDEPKQDGIGYTMTRAEIGLTGTLAELGVSVGDVVEFTLVRNGYEEYSYLSGTRMTVRQDGGVSFLDPKLGRTNGFSDDCGHIFRLLSHAKPQGPVITETVTTEVKRIVPGVYGRIRVRNDVVGITVGMVRHKDHITATELTAAIDTLTAVRDAIQAVS